MSRVLIIGTDHVVSQNIATALAAQEVPLECAAGSADALRRLRARAFGVVVFNPETSIEEDLALLGEMRTVRPGVKSIVLAPYSCPEDVIAALRAKVFGFYSPPFDPYEIAVLASEAASDSLWGNDIQVMSAKPGWVTVRANCRMVTAERMLTFAKELSAQLPEDIRIDMLHAFREVLLNAMEHGTAFNPEQVVEVTAVRTDRAMVFYVRDPGAGFRQESLTHAAIANPEDDPSAHIRRREQEGMRPGGYGILLASGTVDELIYNEIGNEVLLIKYVDTAQATSGST